MVDVHMQGSKIRICYFNSALSIQLLHSAEATSSKRKRRKCLFSPVQFKSKKDMIEDKRCHDAVVNVVIYYLTLSRRLCLTSMFVCLWVSQHDHMKTTGWIIKTLGGRMWNVWGENKLNFGWFFNSLSSQFFTTFSLISKRIIHGLWWKKIWDVWGECATL